jgi:uncharacterized delta-60 repeat protein
MALQQTVLRVQTNIPGDIITGATSLSLSGSTNITSSGAGTELSPLTGSSGSFDTFVCRLTNTGVDGTLYYDINASAPIFTGVTDAYSFYQLLVSVEHADGFDSGIGGFREYGVQNISSTMPIKNGDIITFDATFINESGSTFSFYVVPYDSAAAVPIIEYDFLDTYTDIPIKINKSFAELQDIAKRNSDYSIGLTLPGSKKNNRFFETYYNVDSNGLYFDVTKRIPIDVLIDDQSYFKGYMRLNKVSVLDSKIEYDITLYSSVSDLFGKIGNNLMKSLDFNNIDYHFNHYFNIWNVSADWHYVPLQNTKAVPSLWYYPVIHNGYEYSGDTVQLSGGSVTNQTRLYTTTTVGSFANLTAFTNAGGKNFRINSPLNPVIDNQLKPAVNVWGLINLMFSSYGYNIKSDFFNTPWFKLLYMYGYFSGESTKFSYKVETIPTVPIEGVQMVASYDSATRNINSYVCKLGTTIPCFCNTAINVRATILNLFTGQVQTINKVVEPLTTGQTWTLTSSQFPLSAGSVEVPTIVAPVAYLPVPPNTTIVYQENDKVDFSLVFNQELKQIDFLSSIAKKFNLVFVPDPDVPNQIIIEPYNYYIGTGEIHDWSNKISYDKGFTVEPALNYIESELILTDLEDGDDGNKQFKDKNNRLYGENKVFNQTDFKSQTKKIETIFSPEIIRKWDNNVGLPLGINYVSSNQSSNVGDTERVVWQYKGIKTKPKLIFNLGNTSPFLDQIGESYTFGVAPTVNPINSMYFRLQKSDGTNPGNVTYAIGTITNPVVSHTMPMGNPDSNKNGRGFNNDSICNLFNAEDAVDIGLGIPVYNTYTNNDMYNIFYANRINNLYNKNTRFLNGYFDLNLPDIKKLKANDIIKINEQHFTWNKVSEYNLTSPEMTKVELIQTNVSPQTYPDRYFYYQYCNNSTVYKFKTYFNPFENVDGYKYTGEQENSFRRTYFYWSILYDYFIGAVSETATGYTSSYIKSGTQRYAYSIYEITEEQYNTGTALLHTLDSNNLSFIDFNDTLPSTTSEDENPNIWIFSNQIGRLNERAFFNVAPDCATFQSLCSTNFVILSSAPTPYTPTATPTPTPTLTPTPLPVVIGSLLFTFQEDIDALGGTAVTSTVNGASLNTVYIDTENQYMAPIVNNDVVCIDVRTEDITDEVLLTLTRRTYGITDTNGNLGVEETVIANVTGLGENFSYCYTVSGMSACEYNFEDIVSISTRPGNCAPIGDFKYASDTRRRVVTNYISTSDGGYIATGFFDSYSGIPANSIIKLNANLSVNSTFYTNMGTGFAFGAFPVFPDDLINSDATVEQADGKILVGGWFTSYNGTSAPYLCRLNSNGTLDTGFTANVTVDNNVDAIAVQADGKIVIAGTFRVVNGVAKDFIARLNSNGTIDTSFSGFTTGFDAQVQDIAIASDGSIYCTGPFQSFNGTNTRGIAKLNSNGSLNTTFTTNIGTGLVPDQPYPENVLYKDNITILADGTLAIGGIFRFFNGIQTDGAVRLNPDGTYVNYFKGFGFSYLYTGPTEMFQQPDGKVLVTGEFTAYSGNTSPRGIIRLNTDGSEDTTFSANVGAGIIPTFVYPTRGYTVRYNTTDNTIWVGGSWFNFRSSDPSDMHEGLVKLSPSGRLLNCPST